MEPFYYLPVLYIYSGNTKQAMSTAIEAIRHSNSSPGFGWYNIALARSYLYDGQLDSARITLDKAAGFHEIHIGTTLTQPQYDFSISLLRLVLYNRQIEQVKFFDKGWWYHPNTLYKLASLEAQKYTHEYVLATQLALNPERARIIYDLFCGESTVGYDEIWYLMKRYSPRYFMKLMSQYISKDPRHNIRRYFELFYNRLEYETGSKKDATEGLEKLMRGTRLDTAHEKLFLGRLYQSLATAYSDKDQKQKAADYINSVMEEFPQLIPFSGVKPSVHLIANGADDEMTKQVVEDLKNCNINWSDATSTGTSEAVVNFRKKGIKYEVTISMNSANGKSIVKNERFLFMKREGAGSEIAMRMFGSSGASELEVPVAPKKS